MRITQNSFYSLWLSDLNQNRTEMAKLQDEISTGKSVTKASDNSLAFTTSRMIKSTMDRNAQYQNNIQSATTQATSVESALNGIVDQITQLKAVAVQGASDSITASDRQNLASKVDSIKSVIMSEANTNVNGKYLFGGTNVDKPPFYSDSTQPGGVGDLSNNSELKTKISDDVEINYSFTGKELRTTSAGDLFGIIDNLETALKNNDGTAVNNSLNSIDTALDHVTNLTSTIGDTLNRMQFTSNQYDSTKIDQSGELSDLVDTDYSQALSKMQQYQIAYEAALQAHTTITQMSLVNFM